MKKEIQKGRTMSKTNLETTKTTRNAKIGAKGFESLQDKFLLVKVGTEAEPATQEEITAIHKKLVKLFEENDVNCLAFVTHHAVDISIIESHNHNEDV